MVAEYSHRILPDGTVEVTFPGGEVLYSPPVPDWPWEVAHNYRIVVREDQYRAREFVRPGMQVLDVGANVGWFIVLARQLGAEVTAVEPIPGNVHCLELLRSEQGVHFGLVAGAMGSRSGDAVIHCSYDCVSGGSWIVEGGQPNGADLLPVVMETIDALVARLGLARLDFIKVDTEGHEHEVLRGAATTLRQNHPVLAVSAYHKPTDCTTLPELLGQLAPEYPHVEVRSAGLGLELEMFAWC